MRPSSVKFYWMSILRSPQTGNRLPERAATLARMADEIPDYAANISLNLNALMAERRTGAKFVAQRAKVAEKTVNNLLRGRHDPRISILEKVARSFGYAAWQLLAPATAKSLLKSGAADQLLRYYLTASDEGKKTIMRVAEIEARQAPRDGNGNDNHSPPPPFRPKSP